MSGDPFSQNPYSSAPNSYGPPGNMPQPSGDARAKVSGPATGIMVTAVLGIIMGVIALLLNLIGVGAGAAGAMGAFDGGEDAIFAFGQGIVGMIQSLVGIVVGIICVIGSNKMRNLESYSFSLASAILVMIPCVSPCCLIGLPIGIWAVTVLNDPFVKSSFRG
jgi:hypothetical protein